MEKIPVGEALFDPVIFSLTIPNDMAGAFNGTIGKGQISLAWDKSGATITGRSRYGDFEVKGGSLINYYS